MSAGSVRLFRSLNHNCLHSLRFQVQRGGLFPGEAQANMKEFDRRCRIISELERTPDLQNLQNLQRSEMWAKPDCGLE